MDMTNLPGVQMLVLTYARILCDNVFCIRHIQPFVTFLHHFLSLHPSSLFFLFCLSAYSTIPQLFIRGGCADEDEDEHGSQFILPVAELEESEVHEEDSYSLLCPFSDSASRSGWMLI